uniref:Uncharacterized protein n=1 Tax=Nymphaea colorata TaxID=210225 RepID=A0A5K1DWM0_9MAGN
MQDTMQPLRDSETELVVLFREMKPPAAIVANYLALQKEFLMDR